MENLFQRATELSLSILEYFRLWFGVFTRSIYNGHFSETLRVLFTAEEAFQPCSLRLEERCTMGGQRSRSNPGISSSDGLLFARRHVFGGCTRAAERRRLDKSVHVRRIQTGWNPYSHYVPPLPLPYGGIKKQKQKNLNGSGLVPIRAQPLQFGTDRLVLGRNEPNFHRNLGPSFKCTWPN